MELYCIKHGRMEKAQHMFDSFNIYHSDGVEDERAIVIGFIHEVHLPRELDWCEFDGGWATTPPPVVDMDTFIETVAQPSYEEIELLNQSLDGLKIQCGLL